MGQADLPAPRPGHARIAATIGAGLLAALLIAQGCRRREAAAPSPPLIPPPPARPSEFVHPPVPAEPVVKPARAECSAEALAQIAARLREMQRRAARAVDLGSQGARRDGCGSALMTQIDQDLKGPLLDRVLACVAQDETFDPEWNLLEAARAALAACADCARPAPGKKADQKAACQRAIALVGQAEAGAKSPR